MGSLAWRTFRGCFVSGQALPFIEDMTAVKAPTREEGRGRGGAGGGGRGKKGGSGEVHT